MYLLGNKIIIETIHTGNIIIFNSIYTDNIKNNNKWSK